MSILIKHFSKQLLYIFFLTFSFSLFAQQKWVQGNIIIDNSNEIAEGVYVTNKRTKHTTKSNFAGIFFLQAQVNDTIIFQSEWYENRNIILKPLLFSKDQIVVHLGMQTINLGEALISRKLTGILEKDVYLGKKEDDVTRLYRILNVDPDVKPMKDTSALKAGLLDGDIRLTGLDVGRMFDVFSGNLRKRKALIDYESQSYKISEIRSYFGDNYFKIELNIPSYKINEFILTAIKSSENPDLFANQNYFTLQSVLKDYSEKYLSDLFKSRINEDYKEKVTDQELYIGVELDSIPKD